MANRGSAKKATHVTSQSRRAHQFVERIVLTRMPYYDSLAPNLYDHLGDTLTRLVTTAILAFLRINQYKEKTVTAVAD